MVILGVAFLTDASACVLKDGKLLSAVSEERLNRTKLWFGVPHEAIREALDIAGLSMHEVDMVATHGQAPDEPASEPFLKKREEIQQSSLDNQTKLSQIEALDNRWAKEREVLGVRTKSFLAELERYNKPLLFFPHHEAHAACAYYGSGWSNCKVLTADGWGEDASATLWTVEHDEFNRVSFSNTFDSLGYFYGSVTKALGFIPHRHEGKVLGLAAYGGRSPESYSEISGMIDYDSSGKRFIGRMDKGLYRPSYENPDLMALVKDYSREDVSASAQKALEETVCRMVGEFEPGTKLAVAGGIFANVKLNQRILALPNISEVFVFPNMGDGGLSVGVAYLAHRSRTGKKPERFSTTLLGTGITEKNIVAALDKEGLEFLRPPHIASAVAELLADDNVVIRVNGNMEFGPRALGNRSILYQCRDVEVNEWLNQKLNRSEFMPFAPATLDFLSTDYFSDIEAGQKPAKYMTMTFDCTDKMIQEAPAAVHVDNTARPQLVSKRDYPDFYEILVEYHSRTGLGNVINTSFNMHEEPIVRSVEDGLRAFRESGLPWLALGNFLIRRG